MVNDLERGIYRYKRAGNPLSKIEEQDLRDCYAAGEANALTWAEIWGAPDPTLDAEEMERTAADALFNYLVEERRMLQPGVSTDTKVKELLRDWERAKMRKAVSA